MGQSSNTSKALNFNDVPDCWKTEEDIPTFEEMTERIKRDPIFADAFFFQETNDELNLEDGTYQPLVDYQGIAFQELDDNFHIWWQASRGAAKSSTVARWVDGRCLRFPKTEVAIFAPSFRQSKGLFNYCLKYLQDNFGIDSHVYKLEYELSEDPKIGHEPVIVFRNGSRIRAFPCGDGEKLRGLRANIIIIDEFYQFEKQLYNSHIAPIGNVQIAGQQTKMIHLTTSAYQDCFAYTVLQSIARMIVKGRPGYCILDTRLDDVIRSGFKYDKAYVLHQLDTQSDPVTGKPTDDLLMTFFNVWLKNSANFYSTSAFTDCKDVTCPVRDKRIEGDKTICVGGLDPATSGDDACAMGIIGLPGMDQRDLWAIYKHEKLKPEEIAGLIHKYTDRYQMPIWVFDKSAGLGMQIADLCAKEDQFYDGKWHKCVPIMIWDHPDARLARAHIILNKPTDERIRNGIMGPRYDSAITGEIDLKNWFHLNMKRCVENGKFRIPLLTKDTDYYENERGEIMDNINEAISQFPRIDRVRNQDGSLKTDYRGNYYFTRPSKDDLAYSVIYANYAANIWYRENESGIKREGVPIIWQQKESAERAKTEKKHKIVLAKLF